MQLLWVQKLPRAVSLLAVILAWDKVGISFYALFANSDGRIHFAGRDDTTESLIYTSRVSKEIGCFLAVVMSFG